MSTATISPSTPDASAAVQNGSPPAGRIDVPAEGLVTVSLDMVDLNKYPNYRTKGREETIMERMKSIVEHGQLQPCLGAWTAEGKIGMMGGFTRYEAMERIALKKVIKEYNEAMGHKETTDPGHIPTGGLGFESRKEREKVRQAGGEWATKYEAALKSYKIEFKTTPVEDDIDAGLKAIASNGYEEPPLMDTAAKINKLISQGATAKKVAKALATSEPTISHFRKIFACSTFLTELFKGPLNELLAADKKTLPPEKKAEEIQVLRGVLATAVGELVRRLELEQADPKAISFSHAREFAYAVMAKGAEGDKGEKEKDKTMTLAGVVKILKDLVCMDENGKLADRVTPDLSVFRAKLRDAQRIGKAVEVPAAVAGAQVGTTAAAPAAAPAGVPAGVSVTSLSAEQQAQFAAYDQAAATAAATPAAATPAAPTVPTGVAPPAAVSSEDAAKMAEIDLSNEGVEGAAQRQPGDPDDPDMDDLLGPTEAELLEGEEGLEGVPVTAGVPAAPATPGQMERKTTDAPVPVSKYTVKPPEKIEVLANRFLDYFAEEDNGTTTLFDRLGYLLSAVKMFEAIGMANEAKKLNELYINFGTACSRYLTSLENAVKEARGEATLTELQGMRPKFDRPKLVD